MKLFLLVGLCALVVFPAVRAEDAEAGDDAEEEDYDDLHPLTDMPESHPEVAVVGSLPRIGATVGELNTTPMGDEITALVGVVNNGQETITVTGVMGSLNNGEDFSYYLQNFTHTEYGYVLEEGEEVSVGYVFKTRANLDPNTKYTVALTAFYENEEELFSATFFNRTMEFSEAPASFDFDVSVLVLLVAVVGSGYVVFQKFGGENAGRSLNKVVKKVTTATAAPVGADALDAVPAKMAAGAGRKRSKKKSGSKRR